MPRVLDVYKKYDGARIIITYERLNDLYPFKGIIIGKDGLLKLCAWDHDGNSYTGIKSECLDNCTRLPYAYLGEAE